MREIKFRFWSGKKMFHDLDNVMECLKQQLAFDQNVLGLIQYDHVGLHKSAFMQFTGLTDKNGKDIYEGDILDFETREWGMPGFKSTVQWDAENAEWDFGGGVVSDIQSYRKIIGNIYEHPHLLNSEQNDNRSVATKLPNEPEDDKQK